MPRARLLVVCLWLYSAAPLSAQLKEHEDARFYVLYGRCYLNIIRFEGKCFLFFENDKFNNLPDLPIFAIAKFSVEPPL